MANNIDKHLDIITLIFLSVMIALVGCTDEPSIKNIQSLPSSVKSIVSPERLKDLENLGITINRGTVPPNIEGSYHVSPFKKINTNFEDDYNEVLDYTYTFSEQDNAAFTILVEELNNVTGTVGNGNGEVQGAAISGHGNFFSVFAKIHTDYPDGAKSDMISVISGELIENGIKNFQYALIMDDNYGNAKKYLMANGQGRLWAVEDGIALWKGKLTTPDNIQYSSYVENYFNIVSTTWDSVPHTQFYIVNWSLDDRVGSFTTYNTSAEIKLPNITGTIYVNIYACDNYENEWIQSDKPAYFSYNTVPPPRPGPSPDLYTPLKEINIPKLQLDMNSLATGFEFVVDAETRGPIKLLCCDAVNDIWEIEASSDILRTLDGTIPNGVTHITTSKAAFLNNKDFVKYLNLQKLNYIVQCINIEVKIVDISYYWHETGDWSGALAWGACEGIKIGTVAIIGAMYGSIVPGAGTIVGGIIGAGVGLVSSIIIDNTLGDCKETFTK